MGPPAMQLYALGLAGSHIGGEHSTQAVFALLTVTAGVLTPLEERWKSNNQRQVFIPAIRQSTEFKETLSYPVVNFRVHQSVALGKLTLSTLQHRAPELSIIF